MLILILFTVYPVPSIGLFIMSAVKTFDIKVPETFLISASCALFPDSGGDGTVSISFTHWQLSSLGVAPEEGPAGVAGDPAVVHPGLLHGDPAHRAPKHRVHCRYCRYYL